MERFGIARTKLILLLLLFIVLSVVFGERVFKQYDLELFHHNIVSILNWMPLTVLLILIGVILNILGVNSIIKALIIYWPVIHLIVLLIGLATGLNGLGIGVAFFFYVISPPFSFLGEAMSIGYSISSILRTNEEEVKRQSITIKISLLINLVIMIIVIFNMSQEYFAPLF